MNVEWGNFDCQDVLYCCGCFVQVSIVHYSRPHDIKKAINEQFANELPHVRISLSKLRSLKRDMHKAAKEVCVLCGVRRCCMLCSIVSLLLPSIV